MKSIFLSRSRVKPQKVSQNDPKFTKAAIFENLSDKKRGPHKKDKKGTDKEKTRSFFGGGGGDNVVCGGKSRAWAAPPSMRFVSPHKASDNERCSSEYYPRLSGLQKESYGHRSDPNYAAEIPSGGGHFDIEFESDTQHQNWNKSPHGGTSFSSWFGPTLKYVFESEKDDRNEIRVLALGIQQFIDEIFDALDCNKTGYVHYHDLEILCSLLGKNLPAKDANEKCLSEICANETCAIHVHYYEFKHKLQNLFESAVEIPHNISDFRNNDKLIETVAKVTRRTKSLKYIAKLLEDVEDKFKSFYATDFDAPYKGISLIGLDKNRNQRESKMKLKNLDLQRQVLLQLQELQCLREIVEDFRVALQTSDAENLALRVASKRASERNNLRHLSFPNEDDSIDRLIINFPSSETLQASDPNLPNFHHVEGTAKTSSQNLMESQFRNLLDKSYEDLDIQYELEEVYRELFEAKEKIAELKLSLDRNKTRELNEATFQLNLMSEEVAEAAEGKKILEEEIQRCRKQMEERNAENDAVLEEMKELKENYEKTVVELEEMKELKENYEKTVVELEELKNNFKQTKKFRKQELKQFADLRKLLVDALAASRDSKSSLTNNPAQSQRKSFALYGSKDRMNEGAPKESILPIGISDGSRMITSETLGKRKLDKDFLGLEAMETYDNVDNSEHYRMKLRRRAEQEEMNGGISFYESGEENQFYESSSIHLERVGNDVQRKKVRKDVRSINNMTRILPSTDIKPVLEVKPNIIKPWISLDQSPNAADTEANFEKEKSSYGNFSHGLNELELAKVSSDLCKEITETFSSLNETMESCGSSESYGSVESYGSTKKSQSNSLEGYDSCNSFLSDYSNYLIFDEKEEERRLSSIQNESIYDIYENFRNYGMSDYASPGFEEISTPFKPSPRNSTQILESLEFEVDLLRKSLEEENLWR